jgi:hypothetical protein
MDMAFPIFSIPTFPVPTEAVPGEFPKEKVDKGSGVSETVPQVELM